MKSHKSDSKVIRIALDAMGGDFAPVNEVHGAIKVFDDKLSDFKLEIVFVGDEKKIQAALAQYDNKNLNYSIIHADEVITMDDEPSAAIKKKKNSSLFKGLELHSQGKVDAFVSAGNTGAVLSTATVLLGRIQGVSRPTIGSFLPTQKESPCFFLDVGANIDCKPRFLYEFAVMGSIHSTHMLGLENPSVALLNIGEEKSKGSDVIQETFRLLKESRLNFVGNVEGGDILKGDVDIVVCDGFTGNIILKFAESILGFFKSKIKAFGKKNIINLGILGFMKPFLTKIFSGFDYEEYGGVPLLGVDGVVIIGHGKSSAKAIQYMILKAVDMITKNINSEIEQALNPDSVENKEKAE
ncbi:phosphate acyltransferase PlsX [Bacteroidota bacterium]